MVVAYLAVWGFRKQRLCGYAFTIRVFLTFAVTSLALTPTPSARPLPAVGLAGWGRWVTANRRMARMVVGMPSPPPLSQPWRWRVGAVWWAGRGESVDGD